MKTKGFNYEAPSRLGSELTKEEQSYVLAAFVHRFTRDHKPQWALSPWKDNKPYPVQFDSDKEWLANTRFNVTESGALDRKVKECNSTPTWPDNPELRK